MRARDYYDEFAGWYERERGAGYHRLVDDLEVGLVERYGRGSEILEAGCGTGLLLSRVATFAKSAYGVDLSKNMVAQAGHRGLAVAQGSITDLPFADERFDLVYSFKVLPHVQSIREALVELARVTRRGGTMLLEFYNPWSLRGLVKRLKTPSRISEQVHDTAVFTRYDDLAAISAYLPGDVRIEAQHGIRVLTPVSHVHRVPVVADLFAALEHQATKVMALARFGGFLVVVCRRV